MIGNTKKKNEKSMKSLVELETKVLLYDDWIEEHTTTKAKTVWAGKTEGPSNYAKTCYIKV